MAPKEGVVGEGVEAFSEGEMDRFGRRSAGGDGAEGVRGVAKPTVRSRNNETSSSRKGQGHTQHSTATTTAAVTKRRRELDRKRERLRETRNSPGDIGALAGAGLAAAEAVLYEAFRDALRRLKS